MRQLLGLATITLVLLLAATPAHAGLLALDFQGETYFPSSLGSTPIPFGTSYTVQADFDPTTGTIDQQGIVGYEVQSLAVTVGGTYYTVTDPSDFLLTIVDPTNQVIPGYYSTILDNISGTTLNDELGTTYTAATPAFSAADPIPTVFSGYTESQSFGNAQTFSTAAGPLILSFNLDLGLSASINSVPEPSSLALCGIGVSIGLVDAWRRRKRAA
jgi:hypothetical protein